MTFHDEKLWQEAYVATLDTLEATDAIEENDLVDQIRKHAMMVVTVSAEAVEKRDRKERDIKLRAVAGIVTALRSLLSLAWGQKLLTDETFGSLDGAYEALFNKLPR